MVSTTQCTSPQTCSVLIARGLTMHCVAHVGYPGTPLPKGHCIRRPLPWFVFLWGTLAAGWLISQSGGFCLDPGGAGQGRGGPCLSLLFSGIVFSTLLSTSGAVSGAMAMNLLGAICGGLLEYNSMYFGFRSLYIVAIASYLAAILSNLVFSKGYKRAAGGACGL